MDTGKPKSSSKAERPDQNQGGLEKGRDNRGGAFRKPCLDMDEERLGQLFDVVVAERGAKAFDCGEYNERKVAQAASATGLAHCQHWINDLALGVSSDTCKRPLIQCWQCIKPWGDAA